ncbi:hypothetical protein ACLOJK_032413 [Asimina triloba]
MFTPQQKGWSGWLRQPGADGQRKGLVSSNSKNGSGKGKGVEGSALPAPPLDSLGENGGDVAVDSGGDMEVWQHFREAGFLDKDSLEKKDREALLEKLARLEKEIEWHLSWMKLYEYQYNMGLLLIEKNEWTSKYEDLKQMVAETEESLKREKSAHFIALSEVEKREENLKEVLGVEKQCVMDLEKALHEMRAQYAEIKFTADKKLSEAHALIAGVEEKSLEVNSKLHSADARLAEANRKSAVVERKIQELEGRESLVCRERLSIKAEREAHEDALSKQREELREWEGKLREGQTRLYEGQRLLNQREEKENEKDKAIIQKEKDLEEAQKKIEKVHADLKEKEADMRTRLSAVTLKEEEAVIQKKRLEEKEEQLAALEQKLHAREKMEIQHLIDEHVAAMDSEKREFELEMDRKRKSVDEELQNRRVALEQKQDEVSRKEENLAKREQNLEKKLEKLKEREKDYDSKLKTLKERDKSVKAEEKSLEKDKKLVEDEKQTVLNLRAELDKARTTVEEGKQQIIAEQENLRVIEEERNQFLSLQSKLKLEIDHYNSERTFIVKERENLKQERENFEREWEALDEKRAETTKELNQINYEKEKLDKWKHEEEERLRSERMELTDHIQREREILRLEREAFEDNMKHERSELIEKARGERDDMLNDFESQRQELESTTLNRQEEMERCLREKERVFEEEKEREQTHIISLREQAQREMEEMMLERQRIEREKQAIANSRQQLEQDQVEVRNDIEELHLLSRKLNDQREKLIRERGHLLSVVEQHKNCPSCGELVLTEFQSLPELEDVAPAILPRIAEGYHLKENTKSGPAAAENFNQDVSPGGLASNTGASGGMSWLRKCATRIFNLSPGKKPEDATESQVAEGSPSFAMPANKEEFLERLGEVGDEPEPSFGMASDSVNIESMKQTEGELALSIDDQSDVAKAQGISEALCGSPEIVDSRPEAPKYSRRKRGKKGGRLRATRSVKQVVEEANALFGEASEPNEDSQLNGNVNENQTIEESQGDSLHATDGRGRNGGRKRQFAHTSRTTASEQDVDDSEAHSDSITTGGRRKRRQMLAAEQGPGVKRYNFRRSTVAAAARVTSAQTANIDKEDHPSSSAVPENGQGSANSAEVGLDDGATARPTGTAGDTENSMHLLQTTALKSVMETQEYSSEEPLETMEHVSGTNGPINAILVVEDREADRMNEVASDETDGYHTESGKDDEDEEVDPDDDEKHNASIGKKLWKFFTT